MVLYLIAHSIRPNSLGNTKLKTPRKSSIMDILSPFKSTAPDQVRVRLCVLVCVRMCVRKCGCVRAIVCASLCVLVCVRCACMCASVRLCVRKSAYGKGRLGL